MLIASSVYHFLKCKAVRCFSFPKPLGFWALDVCPFVWLWSCAEWPSALTHRQLATHILSLRKHFGKPSVRYRKYCYHKTTWNSELQVSGLGQKESSTLPRKSWNFPHSKCGRGKNPTKHSELCKVRISARWKDCELGKTFPSSLFTSPGLIDQMRAAKSGSCSRVHKVSGIYCVVRCELDSNTVYHLTVLPC